MGPGIGFEVFEKERGGKTKTGVEFVIGFGAAYEVHLPSGLSFAPTVYVDLIGETGTNVSVGVALGKGF